MFDLKKFTDDAHSGKKVESLDSFVEYVNSFASVILWGAGNLGTAIGKRFKEIGIGNFIYWDERYDALKKINGMEVYKPFSTQSDKKETLVIFCIANVPVAPRLFNLLLEQGYTNVINGLTVLEGILCPLNIERDIDTSICTHWNICVVCSCERLTSLMKHKSKPQDDFLSFDRVHFIVNNFCNLRCTHCFMYMNSYSNDKKKNMRITEIEHDIDLVMSAVDVFGVVNVFGGETFLNPDIDKILEKIKSFNNYGSLIVNTNGVAPIKETCLPSFHDGRIRLAFSNYLEALGDKQKEKYFNNIEFCKSHGINVQTNNSMPTWNISSTLSRKDFAVSELIEKKNNCGVKFLYVFDNKLFPCAMCLSINDLGIADYASDYIDLSKITSAAELRARIRSLLAKPFYETCSHCEDCVGKFAKIAGEQGYSDRYKLPAIN